MPDLTSGDSGGAFDEGVTRFGRWLRKKGWVEDADVVADGAFEGGTSTADRLVENNIGQKKRNDGVRLILEFATAYAITKALLPVRIVASVWATPCFARTVLTPVGKGVGRILGRR